MMNSIYHQTYMAGYSSWNMPRWVRRFIAGRQFHRAWFLGFNGYFEQDGIAYGLSNPYYKRER